MSYILDALRRADAERQQGHVPGLHAATAADLAPAQAPAWRRWLGLWAAGLVVAAVTGVLVWRGLPGPAVAPAPLVSAPVRPAAPAVSPPAALLPALPVVVSAAPVQTPDSVPAADAAPAPKPAAVRAAQLSSLPPDARRQLPALVPGGSVWSDSAASRFVILDGQVLREGDTLAPGLVLEHIERKAAVLRWKDQRVEVPL